MGWQEGYFGLAREARYGLSTAPTVFLPLRTFTVEEVAQTLQVVPYGAAGNEPRQTALIPRGHVEFEAQPGGLGHVLTALLGQPRTTSVSSGVWQHVFEGRGDRPSYSLEGAIYGLTGRAIGAKVRALTLMFPVRGRVQASAEFLAREVVPQATTATTSFQAEESPTWSGVSIQVSGTTESLATGLSITLAAPLAAVEGYGTSRRVSALIPTGPAAPAVGLAVHEQSSAWLSYARNMTELSLTVRASGSLVGASSYQLIVSCPRLRAASSALQTQVGQFPSGAVQLAGYPAIGAVRSVKITLVNVTSGY